MTMHLQHNKHDYQLRHVELDMSDCYTWSFPEFMPFCPQLYYFSTFKDFSTLTQA